MPGWNVIEKDISLDYMYYTLWRKGSWVLRKRKKEYVYNTLQNQYQISLLRTEYNFFLFYERTFVKFSYVKGKNGKIIDIISCGNIKIPPYVKNKILYYHKIERLLP